MYAAVGYPARVTSMSLPLPRACAGCELVVGFGAAGQGRHETVSVHGVLASAITRGGCRVG